MRNIGAIMRRELNAYFFSPITYVVLTLFLLFWGFLFSTFVFTPGGEASLRGLVGSGYTPIVLVLFLSLLGMRLLSEEFRGGTIETLLTAPVTEGEVVLGKFLGVGVFYLVLLVGTLFHAILVGLYGPLDVLWLTCHYLALVLLGWLYLSVALFFSAWTPNQFGAGTAAIVTLLAFTVFSRELANQFEGRPRAVIQHLSILTHYFEMIRGKLAIEDVVFFLSTTALFLFLTTKVLEARRWR